MVESSKNYLVLACQDEWTNEDRRGGSIQKKTDRSKGTDDGQEKKQMMNDYIKRCCYMNMMHNT